MNDMPDNAVKAGREPLFTPPTLPKGGGTVTPASGTLSIGGADGAVGWTLPLPLPTGRTLNPSLSLDYSSSGGNGAFGAGWRCTVPNISRMTQRGVPVYSDRDRLLGVDGEEILPDEGGPRREASLPFSDVTAEHVVTPWVRRNGGRDERLEHWRVADEPSAPGFWLQYHADGSITLFGWSPSARLADPQAPAHVACWYAEETVSATGEHVVYAYRQEDQSGCGPAELAVHGQATGCYLSTVYAMNATPRASLLIPERALRTDDFMTLMMFDYGERDVDVHTPSPWQTTIPWPLREDCFSSWRWGFEQRVRRLCHDVLLWHRTQMMAGRADPTPKLMSRLHLSYEQSGVTSLLVAARQAAYEADGTALLLPPVEFELSRPGGDARGWHALPALDGFSAPHWQLADLHGEGIPGLLYQDSGAWWYRTPQRQAGEDRDAVSWSQAQPLPQAPATTPGGMLTDLDGMGRPEWLVNLPGLRGRFVLGAEGGWSHFVAAPAMPAELSHPAAQLADLSGDGCQDLVMIGPRSVRLYAKQRGAGWHPARDVAQDSTLPTAGAADRLVAFADLAGDGRQQRIEITAEGVRYWPSLGHGRFAQPVDMPGFVLEGFAASRVLLGDTDGSGTTDILYVESDRVRVFINEAGNRFVEGPSIEAPEGQLLDDTCKLQLVDLQGQGSAELVFTVPHMTPRSWAYRFNERRPWLLAEVNNNSAGRVLFGYRSSAQGWLDEKAELQAQGRLPVSHLPFPVHALHQVTTVDDISGLRTVTGLRYRGGVWDGEARVFRGFTRLVQTDTLEDAQGTAAERSPPCQVHHWFLSGSAAHDQGTPGAFTGVGSVEQKFATGAVRFTRLQGEHEVPFEPQGAERDWLLHALKGASLRTETYGLDGSEGASVPYAIVRQRWQIRAYPTANPDRPAALVTPVETLSFAIERIAQDPLVTQHVVLAQDRHGHVLQHAELQYPRQPQALPSGYPEALPEGLEPASRDAQQDTLRLTLSRVTVRNLSTGFTHVSGLTETARSDVLELPPTAVPEGGFDRESLQAEDSPLADLGAATLVSHSHTQWCDADGQPSPMPMRQALVAYTEHALLDATALQVFEANLPAEEVAPWLQACGYHRVALAEDADQVHVGRSDLARYHGAQSFYRLAAVADSEMAGQNLLEWTPHAVAVAKVTDAAGLSTTLDYDWRFITPQSLTDPNQNNQQVVLDALGRVVQARFHGTENGAPTGYGNHAFVMPETVEGMLALKGGEVPVAAAYRFVDDSWMPQALDDQGGPVQGRMGELALRRLVAKRGSVMPDLTEGREPPHVISVQTDRYDCDPAQQIRVSVVHADGAGRPMQTATLSAPGKALQRTAEGALKVDEQGNPLSAQVSVRWAVSGKTEYDNKGQPVRTWLPYYLDDWRPVGDDSRQGLYVDTHLYDAMGRVYRVVTAAGWERRTQFYPWFTVSEDENDTVQ